MSFTTHGNRRVTAADGIVDHNMTPTQDYQQERNSFMHIIRSENELYLMKHPEIRQMLEELFLKMAHLQPRQENVLKAVALHFTSLDYGFDKGIRTSSKLQVNEADVSVFSKRNLEHDLPEKIIDQDTSKDPVKVASVESTNTKTSSFMSIITSASTLMTPDSILSLEQTSSEMIKSVIFKMVNKAVYSQVTEEDVKYDIAYVELIKAVEDAMEIPVIQIREDIIDLLKITFYMFEFHIEEREKIAAENAWERSLKKKWKKILRRRYNYKGYETEQIAKNETSPHESFISDKYPLQCNYNRYPKDRFGVYLPHTTEFSNLSVTAAVAVDEMIDQDGHYNLDTDVISQRSGATYKSIISTAMNAYIYDANRKKKLMEKSKTMLKDGDNDGVTGLTSAHVTLFKTLPDKFRRINSKNIP